MKNPDTDACPLEGWDRAQIIKKDAYIHWKNKHILAVAEYRLKLRYGTGKLDKAPSLDSWWHCREKYWRKHECIRGWDTASETRYGNSHSHYILETFVHR